VKKRKEGQFFLSYSRQGREKRPRHLWREQGKKRGLISLKRQKQSQDSSHKKESAEKSPEVWLNGREKKRKETEELQWFPKGKRGNAVTTRKARKKYRRTESERVGRVVVVMEREE